MARNYTAHPSSPEQQRDRLCYLLGYAQKLTVDGLSERWNSDNPGEGIAQPMKWADRCARVAELTDEMRQIVKAGVDRWLNALLGTAMGEWTGELLLMIARLEEELAAIDPADKADRTREEDRIAARAAELGQRYAELQSLDFCNAPRRGFLDGRGIH